MNSWLDCIELKDGDMPKKKTSKQETFSILSTTMFQEVKEPKPTPAPAPIDVYKCPACGGVGITLVKKGYSVKKGVVGGVLFGLIGLVAGMHRANEVERYCSCCGAKR